MILEDVSTFIQQSQPPKTVREHAKKAWANWLSVAVNASRLPEGRILDRLAEPGGTALAVNAGLSHAGSASLVNAAKAHVNDFDDTHLSTMTHPSTPVLGAIVAGLTSETSWNEALDAVVVGSEVTIGMAASLGSSHYDAGWHVTASAGGIGAAAGLARLWGLSLAQTRNACSLAALQASGLRVAFGSMGKAFQVGRAAECGVAAVLAARVGVDAPLDIFEHPRGFQVLSRDFTSNPLVRLGRPWEFLQDTFKPYPCGIVTHPAIEAAIGVHDRHIPADSVSAIRAEVNPLVAELTAKSRPTTVLEVKFSVSYLIAVGIMDGDAGVGVDLETRPIRSSVQALADRVEICSKGNRPRDSAALWVSLNDGTQTCHSVEHADGSSERPLSWERLYRKYSACTDLVDPKAREDIWEGVRHGRSTPRQVMALLK